MTTETTDVTAMDETADPAQRIRERIEAQTRLAITSTSVDEFEIHQTEIRRLTGLLEETQSAETTRRRKRRHELALAAAAAEIPPFMAEFLTVLPHDPGGEDWWERVELVAPGLPEGVTIRILVNGDDNGFTVARKDSYNRLLPFSLWHPGAGRGGSYDNFSECWQGAFSSTWTPALVGSVKKTNPDDLSVHVFYHTGSYADDRQLAKRLADGWEITNFAAATSNVEGTGDNSGLSATAMILLCRKTPADAKTRDAVLSLIETAERLSSEASDQVSNVDPAGSHDMINLRGALWDQVSAIQNLAKAVELLAKGGE